MPSILELKKRKRRNTLTILLMAVAVVVAAFACLFVGLVNVPFPDAVKALKDKGLFEYLKTNIGNRPFLGICLGMQLLFEKGHEFCECEGLGLIEGEVCPIAFSEGLKIPHMGWNSLILNEKDPLLEGAEGNYYYFVHSFEAITPSENVTAYTHYGKNIVAAVRKNNIWGMQFHPEKSGDMGLDIIRKFCFGGKDVD